MLRIGSLSLVALGFVGVAQAKDIAVVDLPKVVVSAIQKAHPDAKLIKAEEDHEHGALHYEVKVELKDTTRRELEIKPDGTIFKTKASN